MQRSALNVSVHMDPRYGGISTSVPEFCTAGAAEGRYAQTIAALCGEDECQHSEVPSVGVVRLPLGRFRWIADEEPRRKMRDLVSTSDVVHIHGLWQEHSVASAYYARQRRIPYVMSAHGMLERWALQQGYAKKRLYSLLIEKRNLRRSACLRALTRTEIDDYRRMGLRCPIALIPNGVAAPPNNSADAFLSVYPQLRSRRLVLFLGRLHPKKGIDVLIRAWAGVQKNFGDVSVIIAGQDFEGTRNSLERLCQELGTGQSVVFTGMLTAAMKWSALAAATLFVLPSHSEGLSVAILEAMAAGVPAIITRGCNFSVVDEEGCGWITEPEVYQLRSTLTEALRSRPALLSLMGAAGKQVVRSRFSWNTIGRQMADVYDWLLGGRVPSSVEVFGESQ